MRVAALAWPRQAMEVEAAAAEVRLEVVALGVARVPAAEAAMADNPEAVAEAEVQAVAVDTVDRPAAAVQEAAVDTVGHRVEAAAVGATPMLAEAYRRAASVRAHRLVRAEVAAVERQRRRAARQLPFFRLRM